MPAGDAFWGGKTTRFLWHKSGAGPWMEWMTMVQRTGATVLGIPPLTSDAFCADVRNTINTYWRHTRGGTPTYSGSWFHVAQVYDDGTPELRLYIDGIAVGTKYGPSGTRVGDLAGSLSIGGEPTAPGGWWNGSIGPVAFFDHALSGSRIAAHAATGTASAHATAVNSDSPEAFWRFDEASGSLADDTGNGHTGTPAGGTITYRAEGPWTGSYALAMHGDARVTVPDHAAWSSTSFTVTGWCRPAPDPSTSGWHIGSLRFGSTAVAGGAFTGWT